MKGTNLQTLDNVPLLELFRMEVESQAAVVTNGLLALESGADKAGSLRAVMRSTHSIKGAARIVNRPTAARVAHAMEDCLVAAQSGAIVTTKAHIDILLRAMDLLSLIAAVPEDSLPQWEQENLAVVDDIVARLANQRDEPAAREEQKSNESSRREEPSISPAETVVAEKGILPGAATSTDQALRITPENLNRLLSLAGEALIASRWLHEFEVEMLRLKRAHSQLNQTTEQLRSALSNGNLDNRVSGLLLDLQARSNNCQRSLAERLANLNLFDRRLASVATRLHDEVLNSRMRPFVEVTGGYARMVRDLSHALGKRVRFQIQGESTAVDREIMERLKAPLDHLLRNAVDHGIEMPEERRKANKPEEGTLELTARHSAGMLLITVVEDGCGIDVEAVRASVIKRKLASAETAGKLSNEELLEFLFLPGFTMRASVTEISGRGVGLDIVQTAVKAVGGQVRVSSRFGAGTTFQLELPLTLSVNRVLLVEIGGEPYALPLSRVERVARVLRTQIESQEGREHFALGDQMISLVDARRVFGLSEENRVSEEIAVVVVGGRGCRYGFVVDQFLGEREIAVRTLDRRLGKVQGISSAAMMPDGSPVLMIDVDDLVRSVENLVTGQHSLRTRNESEASVVTQRKRVLVVDDSLTVRELERKLLETQGYEVETAIDGMDGWNTLRTGKFDLVLTDIDMPRLDGIELVTLIRRDARLKSLPVMIVSYKDRPEDRQRGMDAGADYYLTKGSFHDETLVRAVADLIGGPIA